VAVRLRAAGVDHRRVTGLTGRGAESAEPAAAWPPPRGGSPIFYRIFYRMVRHEALFALTDHHDGKTKVLVCGPKWRWPTPAITVFGQLITRRSQVQILPPPPRKEQVRAGA
jgi:hypothetical protein